MCFDSSAPAPPPVDTEGGKKEPFIKGYKEYHTDTSVHFEIELTEKNMAVAIEQGLAKKFQMTKQLSTTNMHLFNNQVHPMRIPRTASPTRPVPRPLHATHRVQRTPLHIVHRDLPTRPMLLTLCSVWPCGNRRCRG